MFRHLLKPLDRWAFPEYYVRLFKIYWLKKKGVFNLRGFIKWAGLAILCIGLFACTSNRNAENVHYAKDDRQTLDIYTPQSNEGEKHPVLIYLHGGGWTSGDKSRAASKPAFYG